MATNVIQFEKTKLPAFLQKQGGVVNPFAAAAAAGGFPYISIKGKVFHVQRDEERELIVKRDEDGNPTDEPASFLEVIIVGVNPNKSKTFYPDGYVEGSTEKPLCQSADGIAPSADSQEPQAAKCALCKHNQWGSRVTEKGGKGKSCSDSMRLAVVPAGKLDDPMLVRVPATSLKTLGAYGAQLAEKGVAPENVVTKLGFDYSVAYPVLTFKAVRFVTEEEYNLIELTKADPIIGNITGLSPNYQGGPTEELDFDAAPAAVKKSTKLKDAEEKAESAPKVKVAVESDDDEDEAPKPKAKVKPKAVANFDNIEAALDDLDFDD